MIWESLFDQGKQNEFLDYYQVRAAYKYNESQFSQNALRQLVERVSADTYQFSIPKRITINKINTGKKRTVYCFQEDEMMFFRFLNFILSRRELGIDKACYSFRPGFKVKMLFQEILQIQGNNELDVVKADITDFYNSIPIGDLEWLPEIIKADKKLFLFLQKIYQSEWVTEENRLYRCDAKGIMAGLPICGTLSNLYLRQFDEFARKQAKAYYRYSDDMIFFVAKDQGSHVLNRIEQDLQVLGLRLNHEKSGITSDGKKWEFLGVEYDDGSLEISSIAMQKIKGKIRRAARSIYRWKIKKGISDKKALMVFVRKFNRKFYGYGNDEQEFTWSKWYFGIINSTKRLHEIDRYFQEYGRYLASGHFQRKNYQKIKYDDFIECSYIPLVTAYYKGIGTNYKSDDFN